MKRQGKMIANMLVATGMLASSIGYASANEVKAQEVSTTLTHKVLRLNLIDQPGQLDPAMAEDEAMFSVMHTMFDGLVRLGPDGKVQPSIAQKIDVSDDMKTYTFHLREAKWSNGDPVTAHDFEYAWKRALDPKTDSTYSYLLYSIKNAAQANTGEMKLDEVGVKAIDAKTLRVELEQSTPHFTELTVAPIFYPVNKKLDEKNPGWFREAATHVGNGPFKLVSTDKEKITVVKNDLYWDKAAVKLDKLEFTVIQDENTQMYMFDHDKSDWAGAPFGFLPIEALPALEYEEILQTRPIAGVYWYGFNTEQAPFTNAKIRKAFAYAINRQAIDDALENGVQIPATGALPPMMTLKKEGYFKDNDQETAKKLLAEGMKELGITKLPPITLSFNISENHRLAAETIQKQWKQTLGVDVTLNEREWKVYLEERNNGDYQIVRMGWISDFNYDPVGFLELFKDRDGFNNNTGWENNKYQELLNQSATEKDPEKRKQLLAQAEAILMEDMPVAPIYYIADQWVQNEKLKNVVIDSIGVVDYKWASKE
ncbi:peptide ABC transporter substrate-binding protein [Brevibacillus fortis]|uniref:ABC transporter substrate-binding protein n=1 Tax=Brevibacillus fortis TaxID=2126352 RepID=A0A2P7ULM9_9BACL|nr:peptide ABC transporter substrate-binding protein [Brevibacillus fortis]PSJ87857.1 ABC transporter substrate-binding protein [Brevibacillus fortis]